MIKIVAIIILTAFIFIYDLITPHGMSVSLLYLIPFTLSGLFTTEKIRLHLCGRHYGACDSGIFPCRCAQLPGGQRD